MGATIRAIHFAAILALVVFCAERVFAQDPTPDTRPVIALSPFTNGALGRTDEFEALSAGLQEIMITTLAASPTIRVVERNKLQKILDEQKLTVTGLADPSSVVRVGRILNAQHFVTGVFIVFRGDVRIDVRAFSTETSQVEYVETMQGKEKDLLAVIDDVARKVAAGLKLPSLRPTPPAAAPPARTDQSRAVTLLGQAVLAKDKGDKQAMLAAAHEALTLYPNFSPARQLIDAAEKTP